MEKYLSAPSREWLLSRPKPQRICRRRVPATLDDLTLGDLFTLQNASGGRGITVAIAKVLLNVSEQEIMQAPADQVFGLVLWVGKEIERINKLFDSVKDDPSPEEVQAGVKDLKFGLFGILDWYAARQGISDQNEVLKVKWVRIYKCMDIDTQRNSYARRLRDILNKKK
jgi:hypothetical protein